MLEAPQALATSTFAASGGRASNSACSRPRPRLAVRRATVSNAGAHLVGAATYAGWGHLLARRLQAVHEADERDSQGRVLGLARVRRLGRHDDRRRRPGRSHHASQAGALRRISARPRRDTVRPIAGPERLDQRVRLLIAPVVLGAGERIVLGPLTIEPETSSAAEPPPTCSGASDRADRQRPTLPQTLNASTVSITRTAATRRARTPSRRDPACRSA